MSQQQLEMSKQELELPRLTLSQQARLGRPRWSLGLGLGLAWPKIVSKEQCITGNILLRPHMGRQ